jgi:hypothetical protein
MISSGFSSAKAAKVTLRQAQADFCWYQDGRMNGSKRIAPLACTIAWAVVRITRSGN